MVGLGVGLQVVGLEVGLRVVGRVDSATCDADCVEKEENENHHNQYMNNKNSTHKVSHLTNIWQGGFIFITAFINGVAAVIQI